jgi:hypothetical protein
MESVSMGLGTHFTHPGTMRPLLSPHQNLNCNSNGNCSSSRIEIER